MRHTLTCRRTVRAALATLLLMSALACGGGDDDAGDGDGGGKTPASESSDGSAYVAEVSAAEPFTGYDGYASQQYDGTTHWVCHPDLETDECRDLATTEVAADGTRTEVNIEPATDPPIDCFYAYPTTSRDPAPNADFEVDQSEISTIQAQAAPFATACRLFVPAYRQVPLAAVMSADPAARQLAYDDVLDAFKTYMTQANDGRGFVLIGHSQGAGILQRMVAAEIDLNADLRGRMVSALLLGTSVSVPDGSDVGGDFKEIPGCGTGNDVNCVITYSSYPAASPPSPEKASIFGRSRGESTHALCVNPVELAGGDDLVDPIIINKATLGGPARFPNLTTPYVSLPGSLKAECTETGPYSYLAFSTTGDPKETRATDKLLAETLGGGWGLHLVDVSLPLGDLLEVVTAQGEAYAQD